MSDASNLPAVKRDAVYSQWRGWVVEAVFDMLRDRGVTQGRGGYQDAQGPVQRPTDKAVDALSWIRCESDDDVSEFRLVEVYDGRLSLDGIILRVRKPLAGATTFAATQHYALEAANFGWVKLVTPYEPLKIAVLSESDPIEFGDLLDADADGYALKGSNRLLRALTPYPNDSEWGTGTGTGDADDDHVMVIGVGLQLPVRFKLIPGAGLETGTGTGSPGDAEPAYVIKGDGPIGGLRLKDEAPDPDYPDAEELYAEFTRGVLALGEHVWAELMPDGRWQIRDDGHTQWRGAVVGGSHPVYQVEVGFRGPSGEIVVTVPARSFDDTLRYNDNADVWVEWNLGDLAFEITIANCGSFVFYEPAPDEFGTGTGTAGSEEVIGSGSGSFP